MKDNLFETDMSSENALRILLDGNRRFVSGGMINKKYSIEEIRALYENDQSPVATIVACSDSRVSPEIIFDQGLGKLFVVRNAGNIISEHAIESIKYSVEALKVPLVMILGHNRCGAIKTALEYSGGETGYSNIVNSINPIIDGLKTNRKLSCGELEAETKRKNISFGKKKLLGNSGIKAYVEKGLLEIVTAEYDLKTGKVTIL